MVGAISGPQKAGQFFYIRQVLRLRRPLGWATIGFGLAGLATNVAHVDMALRPLDGRAATHPVTALCLMAVGAAVLTLHRFAAQSPLRLAAGAMIVLVCSARLMEEAIGRLSGGVPSQIFGPVGTLDGSFSIEASVALGAFALAGLLRQSMGRSGMIFLVAGLAVVYNAWLEISYGLTFFNGDVGPFTLLGITAAGLATITIYVHRPSVRVSFVAGEIGRQTRTLIATAFRVPFLCGLILYSVGDARGPLDAAMIAVISWSMVLTLILTAVRHDEAVNAHRNRRSPVLAKTPAPSALTRSQMVEAVEGAWLDFTTLKQDVGVILIDFDYFRRLNRTFGDDRDDSVLGRLNDTLRPHLRDDDVFGCWGMDEALIILPLPNVDVIGAVAVRLNHALCDPENPFCTKLTTVPASLDAPFGYSTMALTDDSAAAAIVRADAALYFGRSKHDPDDAVPRGRPFIFSDAA